MSKKQLSEESLQILKACTLQGNIVKLPTGEQFDRNLYLEVKKHLELIGGKWKGGKTQGFVFDSDPGELLAAQANGEGRDLKQEFQFFATPESLAQLMVHYCKVNAAGANSDFKILEPSAGDGALIKAVHKFINPEVVIDCFELMGINRLKLNKLKNVHIIGNDFLETEKSGKLSSRYDMIIANPPFSKNQDIDHILGMYRCLKTNGRIITIASSSWSSGTQKKQVAFKEWLEDVEAYCVDVPAGSFKSSGTGVGAKLIIIDKLETSLKRACRVCGCTEDDCHQCIEKTGIPCHWVETDLCSACVAPPVPNSSQKQHTDMKQLKIPKEPLVKVLKKVKEVVAKHPTLGILSNVQFNVRLNEFELVATDLQVTIKAEIPCVHEEPKPFSFLLPFDFFSKAVDLIDSEEVTIETDLDKARILGINAEYDIEKIDKAEEFPEIPSLPSENSIKINSDFIEWFNRALDTVGNDSMRPSMTKVFLSVTEKSLVIASTNGHFLLEKTFLIESGSKRDLLVQPKVVKALKGFGETSIFWNDSHVAFQADTLTLIGTLQNETYPAYRSIIPDYKPNVTFTRSELIGAVERASLTSGMSRMIQFQMEKSDTLVIASCDFDYNRSTVVKMEIDYSGHCERISFNADLLLKLLKQVDYSTLSFAISEKNRGVLITCKEEPSYLSFIMPIINEQQ